jgi:hypothetical protein
MQPEKMIEGVTAIYEFATEVSDELGLEPSHTISILTGVLFNYTLQNAKDGKQTHALLSMLSSMHAMIDKYMEVEVAIDESNSVQRHN